MNDPGTPIGRANADAVVQDLKNRRSVFEDFCRKVRDHIEECLRDEEIPFQSIQWRVKAEEKVRSKYLSKTDKYTSLDDLTDIAGLRVITYYEDDVDKAKEVIEHQFAIDIENCEDKRLPDNPETFTYHALHLVISLKPETLGVRAHKQFSGVRGEIQITSILRHAWAEIEHGWYDRKDSFPRSVKRRFARLSALIDLADEQFVELRDEWEQTKESVGNLVQGGIIVPIDPQSLRAFIGQEPLVAEMDQQVASATKHFLGAPVSEPSIHIWFRILNAAGLNTIVELREALRANKTPLIEYLYKMGPQWSPDFDKPGYEKGVCLFHLGMLLFLAKFVEKHSDESKQAVRQSLIDKLAWIGVKYVGTDRYEDQAMTAHRIMAKFSK